MTNPEKIKFSADLALVPEMDEQLSHSRGFVVCGGGLGRTDREARPDIIKSVGGNVRFEDLSGRGCFSIRVFQQTIL